MAPSVPPRSMSYSKMDPYQDDQSTTTRGSSVEKEHLLESGSVPKRRRFAFITLTRIIFLLTLANTVLLSVFLMQPELLCRHTTAVSSSPAMSGVSEPSNTHSHHSGHAHEHMHERPSWQPPERRQAKIFEFDDVYGADPSDEVEEAWTNLIPKGKGYIALPNTTDLPDLPGLNKSWEGDRRAAISMFHQLHCLYLTRDGYFAAKEGRLDEMSLVNTKHLEHCWEYLRQCIMCSADTTLEWISPDETGTTGWGYEHTCKDFDAIYAWAEERRYRELQTIH